VRKEVEAVRVAKAPPRGPNNSPIKAVLDPENKDHPPIRSDSSTVDGVIRAQGGSAPPDKPAPDKPAPDKPAPASPDKPK
jgi:hypothetical protein